MTPEAMAAEVVKHWEQEYQYPLIWEVRVRKLIELIAEAIRNPNGWT